MTTNTYSCTSNTTCITTVVSFTTTSIVANFISSITTNATSTSNATNIGGTVVGSSCRRYFYYPLRFCSVIHITQ